MELFKLGRLSGTRTVAGAEAGAEAGAGARG